MRTAIIFLALTFLFPFSYTPPVPPTPPIPPVEKTLSVPTVSPINPLQGDTVVVSFSRESPAVQRAHFNGKTIPFFPYQESARAVFGISPTQSPGVYLLRITFIDGEVFEKEIRVRERKFAKVVLGIPKKLGLTPQNLVSDLQTKKVALRRILDLRTPEIFFNKPFGLPLRDNRRIGSPFGEIRKTGETEIRHLGTDLSADLGAPVVAINGGIVRKAYNDSIYGNSVILDHGQGIFSLYLHLNEIKANEGDNVKKGTVIGTVGQTGYSTGPHLHLSIKVSGVSVDPIRFVANFK